MIRTVPFIAFSVLAAALVCGPGVAVAAPDETLRCLMPRASGTTPVATYPTVNANAFWLYAYPGIEYRAYAVCRGGTWPYTYALSGAPSGMTVDWTTGASLSNTASGRWDTGKITWPNPDVTTGTITLTVTDAVSAQVQVTWTVTVTSATSRFIFVDCDDAAGGNTGAIGNPYASIDDLYAARPAHTDKIVYFQPCASTYRVYDMAGLSGDRKDFHGCCDPMQWLAVPGGTKPTFDVGYIYGGSAGGHVRFQAGPAAFIGWTCTNVRNKCINTIDGLSYVVLAENTFDEQHGTAGENPGYWQGDTGGGWSDFLMILRNEMANMGQQQTVGGTSASCLKMYAQRYPIVTDNYCHHSGTANVQGIDLKGDNQQTVVRNNLVHDVMSEGIGGNQQTLENPIWEFNRVYNCESVSSECIFLNRGGFVHTDAIFRRNSISGRLRIQEVDALDGPFNLSNNVLVTADGVNQYCAQPVGHRIECFGSDTPTRIVEAAAPNDDGVYGTGDGCMDATALLIGPCASLIGTKGAQLAAGGGASYPAPPRRLRIGSFATIGGI